MDKITVDYLLKMFEPSERYIHEAQIDFPVLKSGIYVPSDKLSSPPDIDKIARQSVYLLYLNSIADGVKGFPDLRRTKMRTLDESLVLFPSVNNYGLKQWPSQLRLEHEFIYELSERFFFVVSLDLDGYKSDVFGEIRSKRLE